MKSVFLVLVLCVAVSVIAQSAKELTRDYKLIPEGTFKGEYISGLSCSQYEVTQEQYKQFLKFLKATDLDKYRTALPDTSKWADFDFGDNNMSKDYFRHPAFGKYPVVNVSNSAAMWYCEWLTERYNSVSSKKVVFRLPTETEWEYIASAGNEKAQYAVPQDQIESANKKIKTKYLVNAWFLSKPLKKYDEPDTLDGCFYMCNINAYYKNDFGMYNMSGNVSELVGEGLWCKGGSWHSPIKQLKIPAKEPYAGSQPYLGFRPVMAME